MVVCRYWQQGNCRYGNNCRNEHPAPTTNRFNVFGGGGGPAKSSTQETYGVSREGFLKDLGEDRPAWILSGYAPGKDAPDQLWGGQDIELSQEEARNYYYAGVKAGNPQQAIDDVNRVYQAAEAKIRAVLNDPDAAVKYVLDAANKHPNRHDIVNQSAPSSTTGLFGVPQTSAFGAATTATTATSTFGQPASLGQQSRPFGAPAFGQPSQPAASGFGQPSQHGTGGSPFGQPSQPGAGVSAFGQASSLGQKPNPFGAPAFGQPAQPAAAAAPAFGQPSQAGTFGRPSQPGGGGSGFGLAAALGQTLNPFAGGGSGTSPFLSAGTAQANAAPAFGAPSAPAAQASSIFAMPAATSSPFAAQPPSSIPFGAQTDQAMDTSGPAAPSGFGQPTAAPAANPFGQPSAQPSGFGQPSAAGNPFASRPAFGQPSAAATAASATPVSRAGSSNGPYGPNATRQHPAALSYITLDSNRHLIGFKGRPVSIHPGAKDDSRFPAVQNPDGSFSKIWMPDGPPGYYKDTELHEKEYSDHVLLNAYKYMMETGKFKDGKMPLKAPKREWCTWDF